MRDDAVDVERQAISDYRLALGLDLKERRTAANYGYTELSALAAIPAETLRSYERGTHQPQLVRLARLANVYGVSVLDILVSTAEYIYRANGEPIPNAASVPADKIVLRSVLLYCGLVPSQLQLIESVTPRSSTGFVANS